MSAVMNRDDRNLVEDKSSTHRCFIGYWRSQGDALGETPIPVFRQVQTSGTRTREMWQAIVELLSGLLLSALPLLIGACIVGSVIAALRAIGGGS